ncbi:hypothetical protein F7725_023246 [Dissostichus mawsoni]|uniref:Non-haem dioxygenase N-terminal domain-containing protein n=1 Tax=Dissostichus mawsoni TaxID=36200 RepID=A0A7J5Z245_DISMA|nr:hypothetical protein F7725_023246 [Dissostichus mawsoni]
MISLSKDLETAFTEVGFVFLKNTGITQEEVDRVMAISKTFFLQPDEEKQPFSRKSFAGSPNHGWVSFGIERLNPSRPGDLKEAFNITSLQPDIKWPSGAVKGFREIQTSFFQHCKELSLRVLKVMAFSLGLDPEVFLSAHRFIGEEGNCSTLRTLYYPPVKHEEVKEGQLRCGEHSDYGSITLLFKSSEGLQLHRVLLPPPGDLSTRQSLAFFVQPDDEALICCCDGSNKYPPVTGGGYIAERFKASYGQN